MRPRTPPVSFADLPLALSLALRVASRQQRRPTADSTQLKRLDAKKHGLCGACTGTSIGRHHGDDNAHARGRPAAGASIFRPEAGCRGCRPPRLKLRLAGQFSTQHLRAGHHASWRGARASAPAAIARAARRFFSRPSVECDSAAIGTMELTSQRSSRDACSFERPVEFDAPVPAPRAARGQHALAAHRRPSRHLGRP